MPKSRSLTHVPDAVLLHDLITHCRTHRSTTAVILAHLAEVDARRLYVAQGYPSMFLYCVHELRFSEDAAFKRIRAARAAREFPVIFEAVAEGRLHLAAVVTLRPFLTKENAEELLASAAGKTRSELELLLAERFPRPDVPTLLEPARDPACANSLAPGPVDGTFALEGDANQVSARTPLRRIAPL